MNKTRLFVYKEPTLHNPTFEHTLTTLGDYRDDWWQYPTGTVFTNGCIVPFPDTLDGDYTITQNIGIPNNGGVVYLAITIDKWGVPDGMIDIGIGNAHYTIDPSLYANNTFPYTIDLYELNIPLNANNPDSIWNYYVTIRGSGGTYLAGNPVKNWGIKSIYLRGAYSENYREVDLYDNLEVPVFYNVADVRDISKKDSNFSLDFSVPNTPNNADLFDHIYEITDNASMFEILKQYPCYLEVDNNRTFEGYFKLTQVTINDNKEVSYKCNLYSNVIEFVKRLGTTTLRGNENVLDDLSFSEYTFGTDDRPFDADSWFRYTDMFTWDTAPDPDEPTGEKPYGKDCYFAVVDNMAMQTNLNRFDVSDINHRGINLFLDELTPFLFYKEIWDKLFKWAGFSYVSDFIENTANNKTGFEFDHLAYPAVNDINRNTDRVLYSTLYQSILNSQLNPFDRHFYGVLLGSWTGTLPTYITTLVNPTLFDQWTQSTIDETVSGSTICSSTQAYRYTFTEGGVYECNIELPLRIAFYMTNSNGSILPGYIPATVNADTNAQYMYEFDVVLHQTATNTDVVIGSIGSGGLQNYASSYNDKWNGSFIIYKDTFTLNRTVYAQQNDYIYFTVRSILQEKVGNNLTFTNPDDATQYPHKIHFEILNADQSEFPKRMIDIRLKSTFYIDGSFDPTVILNPNRKKIDFINDIIKKFNLYIEDVTDKKDDNGTYYRDYATPNVRRGEPILRIEPRNMYYDNRATVVDWTDRVDTDSIEFRRIDDYLYTRMYFNDTDEQPDYVKDYNGYDYVTGEYGEKIEIAPYNTSEDEKTEVKTDFGQTMVGRPFRDNGNDYLECPHIFSLNDSGELQKDKSFNDRMLFVFNLYPGTDPYNIYPWNFNAIWNGSRLQWWRLYIRDNSNLNQFNNSIQPWTDSHNNGIPATMRSFCTLNNFNVPFGSDTADLNFGWAMWYYQNLNGTWATSNNCYNQFYQRMVDDYNNVNARIMTCNCYLSPEDMRDLQLSDTVLINNVPYHINKIEQWKNGSTPTKCEFIKILDNKSDLNPVFKKDKDKYNNPPKPNIVTPLSVQTEMTSLLASQNEIIVKMQATMKSMDERIKKLEEGGSDGGGTTGEDGKEENKEDYD